MPGPAAALVENGQVGRVEEQQMECLMAYLAEKEAARTHPMQAGLGLLRPALEIWQLILPSAEVG